MFSMQTVHIDSLSGASTVLFTFTIDRGVTWEVSRGRVVIFLENPDNIIVVF
jgi:hypothetical protein